MLQVISNVENSASEKKIHYLCSKHVIRISLYTNPKKLMVSLMNKSSEFHFLPNICNAILFFPVLCI